MVVCVCLEVRCLFEIKRDSGVLGNMKCREIA